MTREEKNAAILEFMGWKMVWRTAFVKNDGLRRVRRWRRHVGKVEHCSVDMPWPVEHWDDFRPALEILDYDQREQFSDNLARVFSLRNPGKIGVVRPSNYTPMCADIRLLFASLPEYVDALLLTIGREP